MKQFNFELRHTASQQYRRYDDTSIKKFIAPCLNKLKSLLDKPIDRPDLEEIHCVRETLNQEEVMWKLFHTVIFGKGTTVQQLLGLYWNQLDMQIGQRKARVMEPFFIALTASPYINVHKKGVEFIFTSTIEVDVSDCGYVLPCLDLPVVVDNTSIGYGLSHDHVITGHPLKHHDKEICLDHINRLNSTCYKAENRLLSLFKPAFDSTPKLKGSRYETIEEVSKREEVFNTYEKELPGKIQLMMDQGNKFHL